MKATFKGSVQLAEEDLYKALLHEINREKLTTIVSDYLQSFGYKTIKVQCEDNIVTAEIETADIEMDGEEKKEIVAKKSKKSSVTKKSSKGLPKKWKKFYPSIGEILEELRSKNRKRITFDALYERLLKVEDESGEKRFIKDGGSIEDWRVKQYLTPSQLLKNKQTETVKWDPTNETFHI